MDHREISRRYLRELLGGMLIYIILLVSSLTLLKSIDLTGTPLLAALVAIAPAIGVVLVMLALMRLLRDSDEFLQRIQLQATAFAAGVTAMVTFSYGFLENVGLPKFPTFAVLPMMILLWGLGLAYFNRRYE